MRLLHVCRCELVNFDHPLLSYLSLSIISFPFLFISTHIIFFFRSIIHYSFSERFTLYSSLWFHLFSKASVTRNRGQVDEHFQLNVIFSLFIFTAVLRFHVGTYSVPTWNMPVVIYFLADSGTRTATSVIKRQYNLADCRCGSAAAHTHSAWFRVQVGAS